MPAKKNNKEISPKAKLRLLTMVNWSYKEIMQYFNYGKNKAIDIKKTACQNGGAVRWHSDEASVKVIMELQGTTVDEEIAKIEKILSLLENKKETKEEN